MASPTRPVCKLPGELIQAFKGYKLETTHQDDRTVVHKIRGSECVWKKRQRIGAGASGAVWLQEKEGTGELRAIKMLARNPQTDPRHPRELLALVKLKAYPRLFVAFLGWYENHEHIFLAMEYIEGGDLSKYIARGGPGPKPILEVKEIARQILEGLEVLHSLSIYHRDLKPQNVLIACLNPIWVKIADFGVSKRENNSSSLRSQVGTYGYMAPELLGYLPKRKARYLAYALDMWSLGILLHEIMTSKTPFCRREAEIDLESDPNPDSDTESGASYVTAPTEFLKTHFYDEELLKKYCSGHAEFPVDLLEASQLCKDGIAFLKVLLVVTPKDRLTATCALQTPWLKGHCRVGHANLKRESSLPWADLDLGSAKELRKERIAQFISDLAEEKALSLLTKAAGNGYCREYYNYIIEDSLRRAMKNKQFEAAGILLGKPCTEGSSDEEKVLHLAFEARCAEVVDTLLEHGIPHTRITILRWMTLYLPAIRSRSLDILKIVIKRTNINHKVDNSYGRTPLSLAAKDGYFDAVRLFMDSGADVNARCGSDRTSLGYAAEDGYLDIVRLLLTSGADAKDECPGYAARGGHWGVVKLLLDSGADVNSGLDYVKTAMEYAASSGRLDMIKFLLDRGADMSSKSSESLTGAARGGHFEVVKFLLASGANINTGLKSLKTAIGYAAGAGHLRVVKLMLNSGASTEYAIEALRCAARGGHSDVIKLILDSFVDMNTSDQLHQAVLGYANRAHQLAVSILLFDWINKGSY